MKYNCKLVDECADWVRENGLVDYGGAKLKDFCSHFGIGRETYYRWLKNGTFETAIKKAKEDFMKSLENDVTVSLARAAKGYDYEQVITEYGNRDDKPYIRKQTKKTMHVEPNVGAAIFLLTNLNPEMWKNKQSTEMSGSLAIEPITGMEVL